MLANLKDPGWWYMEVPRTGSSTIERTLKSIFPDSHAIYAKHWPILPPQEFLDQKPVSITSVRNPYSRAVSCWQFFTVPGEVTFKQWTEIRLKEGWFDVSIEARPQSFWLDLCKWDYCIRQDHLDKDFWDVVNLLDPTIDRFDLHRYNDINGQWVNRLRKRTSRNRPWQEYYCPATEANVLELYASDFDTLDCYYEKTFPGNVLSS